jgi:hypothetical protein
MLDLMQQELDFSLGEALTLASLTVDLIRRPAFTYRSTSVPGKPPSRPSALLRHRIVEQKKSPKTPQDLRITQRIDQRYATPR